MSTQILIIALILTLLSWDHLPDLWRGLCWLGRWMAVLMLWAIVIAMIGALLHIGWETGRYALELWGHQ